VISLEDSGFISKLVLKGPGKVGDAVRLLNDHGLRIVLVVDDAGKLHGVITDGDVRRGLLKGLNLDSPFADIVKTKPIVVTKEVSSSLARHIMAANGIFHLPVVSPEGLLLGIHMLEDEQFKPERTELFVIMAGGKGVRLMPKTLNCPKPMLPVNGKPMLEHIIERAREEGFRRFVLAVNYLAGVIEDHFRKGDALGVEIDYLREQEPLGTAGAISLLPELPNIPIIVTNGDVLTDVKYSEILDFHRRHGAKATMAIRQYEWQHPFGVVRTSGMEIIGFEEKPVTRTHVNAGIYILEPELLGLLVRNQHCNMPELFTKAQSLRYKTMAYPMHEPWLDVGRPADLEKANTRKGN
jgi:dTDP-glucose pyrophosphorylase